MGLRGKPGKPANYEGVKKILDFEINRAKYFESKRLSQEVENLKRITHEEVDKLKKITHEEVYDALKDFLYYIQNTLPYNQPHPTPYAENSKKKEEKKTH